MSELITDKRYKEYLLKVPKLPASAKLDHMSGPWVVYVQKKPDGPWGRKNFRTYKEAFSFFKLCLKKYKVHDLALNCKRIGFEPPTRFVRIKGAFQVGSDGVKRQKTKMVRWEIPAKLLMDEAIHDYEWCMYCRRPTEFRHYRRHPALKPIKQVDTAVRRCCICGASERIAMLTDRRRF